MPEPHLGRNLHQAERGVHFGLGAAHDQPAVGQVDDAVLADAQVLAHRQLAQLDVVLAAAGEVLQQVSVDVGRQDAQVDLQSAGEPDARLGAALGEHRFGALPTR